MDVTPEDDSEFALGAGGQLVADPTSPAYGKVDLLTVLAHELGHALGLRDANDAAGTADVMARSLPLGVRRLPGGAAAATVPAQPPVHNSTSLPQAQELDGPLAPLDDPPARQTLGFEPLDALVGAGAANATSGILNGGFDISDPHHPFFAWQTFGGGAVANGVGGLAEGGQLFADLSQVFLVPDGAATLRFTIVGLSLNANAGNPPDAFEVALLRLADGLPAVGTVAEVSHTDALLNVQHDGTVFFGPDATVEGVGASGQAVSLVQPFTVTVDVSGLAPGTAIALFFDLITFGAPSTAALDNARLLTQGAPGLTFGLDPATDSGTPGDGITNHASVNLVGATDPGQEVVLDLDGDGFDDGSATADDGGEVAFHGVVLPEGVSQVRLQATNAIGTATIALTITVDGQSPSGALATPPGGAVTTLDRGWVEVQWVDAGLAGLDAAAFGPDDITVTGVTVDRISDLGGGLVRYWYSDAGNELPPGAILVTLVAGQVADRAGNTNAEGAESFTFAPSGRGPVVTTTPGAADYLEWAGSIYVDPGVTVTSNFADLIGATVAITGNYVRGEDFLALPDFAGIVGTFDPATGMLTLTGAGTVDDYQAALRGVIYRNASRTPSSLPRTIAFAAADASGEGEPAIRTLNVESVRVEAADPIASEQGRDPGTFLFVRGVVTEAPLVVYYAISGTATNGRDYELLRGWAVIPNHEAAVAVVVTLLPRTACPAHSTAATRPGRPPSC